MQLLSRMLKAVICNSFQVIVWTDTHRYTPLPNASYMHVFMITVRQSSQICKIAMPQTDTLACKQYYLTPTSVLHKANNTATINSSH